MTSRLLRWAGVPSFALFTLALHAWTVGIFWAGGGVAEGVRALLAPVLSWFWLARTVSLATGTWANAYTVAALSWAGCAALVAMALAADKITSRTGGRR